MNLLEVLTAIVLLANPFGRFFTIGGRAVGIELLELNGFQPLEVIALFIALSTISTLACLKLFEKAREYAKKIKVGKFIVDFLNEFQEKVLEKGGRTSLAGVVGLMNFATSPLYAAAACALAGVGEKTAAIGLIAGNIASFLALYFFGQAFGKNFTTLALAAVLVTGVSFALFYFVLKKARNKRITE